MEDFDGEKLGWWWVGRSFGRFALPAATPGLRWVTRAVAEISAVEKLRAPEAHITELLFPVLLERGFLNYALHPSFGPYIGLPSA